MAIDPTAMGNAGIAIGTGLGGPIGGAIGGMVGGMAGDLWNTYVSPNPTPMPDFVYPDVTQMLGGILQSGMAQTNAFWSFANAQRKAFGEHLSGEHLERLDKGLQAFAIARKQLVLKHGAKARAANPIEIASPGAVFPKELVGELSNWRYKAMGAFNTFSKQIKTYGKELNVLTLKHGGVKGLKKALAEKRLDAVEFGFNPLEWLNRAVDAAPKIIGAVDTGLNMFNTFSSFFPKTGK
jgi:hypothetical protein